MEPCSHDFVGDALGTHIVCSRCGALPPVYQRIEPDARVADPTVQNVAWYRDKRADELTRDELIVAYTKACEDLERLRRWAIEDAEMERLFRRTRKRMSP